MRNLIHRFGLIGLLAACFLASGLLAWYDVNTYIPVAHNTTITPNTSKNNLVLLQSLCSNTHKHHTSCLHTPNNSSPRIDLLAQEESRTEAENIGLAQESIFFYWIEKHENISTCQEPYTCQFPEKIYPLQNTSRYLLYGALLI